MGEFDWMRLLDLFSGIGGFSLAAQWVWGDELEIVAFCEIDKFCQKVLYNHWPNVPIIGDVRDVTLIANSKCMGRTQGTWEEIQSEKQKTIRQDFKDICTEGIDLLTGGFPCQPFSVAGKRKGKEDNRFLWPEMFRVIQEIRPRWVVAENVAGIVRMALDNCLSDLEGEGYTTQTIIIPACAVNAPHRRDRVWIVGYSRQQPKGNKGNGFGRELINGSSSGFGTETGNRLANSSQDVADSDGERPQRRNAEELRECTNQQPIGSSSSLLEYSEGRRLEVGASKETIQLNAKRGSMQTREYSEQGRNPESRLGRMVDGIPDWLHEPESIPRVAKGVKERVNRLKSLGNAIVPQVAMQIFRAIKEIENGP